MDNKPTEKAPECKPNGIEVLNDAAITLRHIAPPGITLEMVQRPDYWRNVIREVGQQRIVGRHAFNRIEVLAQDGSWEAELRVMSAADGLATTRLLREWHAPTKPGRKPSLPEGYIVEHIANNGWRGLDPNGAIVAALLTTEDEAIRAVANHAKKAA